jgi:prevent-host-death family protein
MARDTRKFGMKHVALSVAKDDLSRYLREAEGGAILITRHGKPAGILIGFASEEDWFAYRLENDLRFAKRMKTVKQSLRASTGLKMKELKS